ncbi:ABC transporter permease subunit [Halomicrococcus gelatinilyticus]|uniref:ABC transporter permease subunit n=1 Tax=Halomicrococcus gelatinilyticus TaxID=1702103 RepID=UPI002E0E3DAB
MSWLSVAKKDFLDARRSKGLLALVTLYVALLSIIVYVGGDGSSELAMADVLQLVAMVAIFIVPISALVVAYLAVAGERESGSIKYLLGLPYTRRDVVVGKFLGRTAVVAVGLLLAFVVAGALGAVMLASVSLETFASFFLLLLFFAVVYVGIAVGISAACASRSRAMAGAVGVFFVFNVLWTVPAVSPTKILQYVAEDTLGMSLGASVYEFVYLLSPPYAFQKASNMVFEDQLYYSRYVDASADLPFYLDGWFMLVVLGAWLAVPLVLGYWRFQRADLG